MKVINPCWGRYPRYKITRSIRYCSWSNLCPVPCTSCGGRGGPAITDTKRTIIVRRLIQSVVSVISRVWFIWDRTRGRIIRIPRSHHGNKPKNFLAKLVSSSYRYLYLHNGTGTEKFLLAREGWKVWPFFLEGEWSIGGNRSVERIGGYVREWSKDEGREELAFSENTRFRAWQSVLRDEMRFHGVGEDRFRLSSYWRSTFDARRVWNTRLENEREKRSRRFGRGVKSQAGKPGGLPSRLLAPPRHWQSAFRSLPQVSLPSSISQPGHGGISSPTRKWEREVYSDERDLDRRKIAFFTVSPPKDISVVSITRWKNPSTSLPSIYAKSIRVYAYRSPETCHRQI